MKKILFAFTLVSLALPIGMALAQEGPLDCCRLSSGVMFEGTPYAKNAVIGASSPTNCPASFGVPTANEKWGVICALSSLNTIVNWIFVFFVVLAVLTTLWGAYDLLTAAGETAKVTSGRNKIMYAGVGLLVALVARAVPSIVKAIIGY